MVFQDIHYDTSDDNEENIKNQFVSIPSYSSNNIAFLFALIYKLDAFKKHWLLRTKTFDKNIHTYNSPSNKKIYQADLTTTD